MFIKKKKIWEIDGTNENNVTDEEFFKKRRDFLKLGAGSLVGLNLLSMQSLMAAIEYKKDKNINNLKLNTYKQITTYNNFYEFSTNKAKPAEMAHTLNTDNWKIEVSGLVEKPMTISMDTIWKKFPIQERIYKFRCVEAWAMVVPWIGFPLSYLLKQVVPTSKAKYIVFETLVDPKSFPDQARNKLFANIEYPYVEGLRIDEAYNDLSFLAVGLYGKKMPKQNGAPLRLVVPWKYGFKSIKSISKIILTDKQPINTWNKIAPQEYGFYANVNPKVDHPRWSQKKERVLGDFFKQKTIAYNGYQSQVGDMYKNMDLRRYF